jgi:hypothetical protein
LNYALTCAKTEVEIEGVRQLFGAAVSYHHCGLDTHASPLYTQYLKFEQEAYQKDYYRIIYALSTGEITKEQAELATNTWVRRIATIYNSIICVPLQDLEQVLVFSGLYCYC